MRHGLRALHFALVIGCAPEPESVPEPTAGAESEPVAVGAETEVESAEPLPDPHPVVAGFDRELRAWLTEVEAGALDDLELTGTADGETEKLTELIRHVLFRELGGAAIGQLSIPEIERYGADIREMPESPEEPEEEDEGESWFGGYGEGPHMNLDGMGNVVGDLHSQCEGQLPQAQRDREPNRCDERFESVWAALKLARTAYDPLDVEAMGFVDAGRPMGGGEWDRAPPVAMRALFALAERAGLGRERIAEVAVQLLRDLVAFARRPTD